MKRWEATKCASFSFYNISIYLYVFVFVSQVSIHLHANACMHDVICGTPVTLCIFATHVSWSSLAWADTEPVRSVFSRSAMLVLENELPPRDPCHPCHLTHALHHPPVETYMPHENWVQGIQFSVSQAETRLAHDFLGLIRITSTIVFAPSATCPTLPSFGFP